MISVTVKFGNITAAASRNYSQVITFVTVAGQNTYTSESTFITGNVSQLVGKDVGVEIDEVTMDGSHLISGSSVLVAWNDSDFTISPFVAVAGNERVVIKFH